MVTSADSTVVYVAYRTEHLDLSWIPANGEVVVAHNDELLEDFDDARVRHIGDGRNVGFGAAVNQALTIATTSRVILCNPDAELTRAHWDALVDAAPHEMVTIPLVDDDGAPTSTISRYPTPAAHLASGYRLGRFVPRGSAARALAARSLGRWGRAHVESLELTVGRWPLSTHWVSGAACSVDVERLRAVGGFDDRYFLYYEDVDLCRRLARRFPDMQAVVADVQPGIHGVGVSGRGTAGRAERVRLQSAIRYADSNRGSAWRACEALLRLRSLAT